MISLLRSSPGPAGRSSGPYFSTLPSFHGFADFFVDFVDAGHGFDVPFVEDFFGSVDDDFSACFADVFDFV